MGSKPFFMQSGDHGGGSHPVMYDYRNVWPVHAVVYTNKEKPDLDSFTVRYRLATRCLPGNRLLTKISQLTRLSQPQIKSTGEVCSTQIVCVDVATFTYVRRTQLPLVYLVCITILTFVSMGHPRNLRLYQPCSLNPPLCLPLDQTDTPIHAVGPLIQLRKTVLHVLIERRPVTGVPSA